MAHENALAVRAWGFVHSLGQDVWKGRLSCKSAQGALRADTENLTDFVPKKSLRRMPHYARMAALAAFRALSMAGEGGPLGRSDLQDAGALRNMAFVIGTAYGCVQTNLDFLDGIIESGPGLSSPSAFSHAVGNVGAGLVTSLLGIEGPCSTVMLFDLSFAGAVTAAASLLGAGHADAALVGAVDEIDARFSGCCPQILPAENSSSESLPLTEGAVFFYVERAAGVCGNLGRTPRLSVCWNDSGRILAPAGAVVFGQEREALYGHGPLTQALNVLAAVTRIGGGSTNVFVCPAQAGSGGRRAVVEVF